MTLAEAYWPKSWTAVRAVWFIILGNILEWCVCDLCSLMFRGFLSYSDAELCMWVA